MEIIQIKKYENRRLYSSSEKRYVTVAEIAEWIVAGKKIQVVDVVTEKDITADVLTQILLEKGRAQHIPVEMLESLIRFNEGAIKKVWEPMMQQSYKVMEKWNPLFWLGQAPQDFFKDMMASQEKKDATGSPNTEKEFSQSEGDDVNSVSKSEKPKKSTK